MTPKKITIVLSVSLAALFLGLIGGTYALSKMLKTESVKLSSNKAQVEQLTSQESGIAKSRQDIANYAALDSITKTIVPQDKDQAATVRELTNLAAASRVSLTTITFPSSTLGSGTAGAKAAATAAPNLSQLTPVAGLPGVYNLQITIGNNSTNTITYAQLTSFLRGLENNRRTAAVSSINIQPQSSDPSRLVFNLLLNTYIKP